MSWSGACVLTCANSALPSPLLRYVLAKLEGKRQLLMEVRDVQRSARVLAWLQLQPEGTGRRDFMPGNTALCPMTLLSSPRLLTSQQYSLSGLVQPQRHPALHTTGLATGCTPQGTGASEEGNKPFLSVLDLATKESTKVWQSTPPYFESLGSILNDTVHVSAVHCHLCCVCACTWLSCVRG